jgi:DNA end-binding protein Ku
VARAIWKGAVTFGLVHIPVELYSAESRGELHFHMLDRRDLAPVGYQRVNKKSGRAVPWEDIVKGYEYEDDRYVVLTEEDFRLANVEATQTVEIFGFTAAHAIPDHYFETPYVIVPMKRGEKGYALLRDALERKKRVGLANVVMRNRQHVCAVVPEGNRLLVITLRYAEELAALETHSIGAAAGKSAYSARELEMAERLIQEMDEKFTPDKYVDRYRDDLMRRIDAKIKAGETEVLTEPAASNVVDLMTLLKRSLDGRGKAPPSGADRKATVTPLRRRAPARRKAAVPKSRRATGGARGAARVGRRAARA